MQAEKQSEVFLREEGDAWYRRNQNKSRLPDPVLDLIKDMGLRPKSVLEIGCGNGWRLEAINRYCGAIPYGYEPSLVAVEASALAYHGTADDLEFTQDAVMDMVIYSFCLYLVDREDLFKVVAEGDRVLKDGGHLIVHDFLPSFPHSRIYKHKEGIRSYKMDHASLWYSHPGYRMAEQRRLDQGNPDEQTAVTVLRKDIANSFPLKEP